MDDEDKLTLFIILDNIGFYSTNYHKGVNCTRMTDALYNLRKAKTKCRSPPLSSIEAISDDDLKGEAVEIIALSNIFDIFIRLEVFLGLKINGHNDTLNEASYLIHEIYKRREIQNEQRNRNAVDKFLTQ